MSTIPVIIFQTDNNMSAKRLSEYLYRNGWTRATRGVYIGGKTKGDKDKFLEHISSEFLSGENDYFAYIDAENYDRRTKSCLKTNSPAWPKDDGER